MKFRFALILLLAIQTSYAEELYRWVDADGNVQYTQTPPPAGVNAEVKTLQDAPSAVAEGRPEPKKAGKTEEVAETPANDADKMMAEKVASCQKSMQNLQLLESGNKIIEAGKTEPMDDNTRNQRTANEKAYIKTYCDGVEAAPPKTEAKKPEKK